MNGAAKRAWSPVPGLGGIERERRVDCQWPRRRVLELCVERVQQTVRLADAQRRAHAQRAVDALQDPLHGGAQVGEVLGHPRRVAEPVACCLHSDTRAPCLAAINAGRCREPVRSLLDKQSVYARNR